MKKTIIAFGRLWRNVNRRISRAYVTLAAKSANVSLVRLGSAYGGWHVPEAMPHGALCYCVGVGVDASFDFALAERGMIVHSFDPTPGSIEYMARHAEKGVNFHPWGILSEDKMTKFYFPIGEDHHSFFIYNLHLSNKYFEAQCFRLSTIIARLHHSTPYLIKMDIEGAWYVVIQDMLKGDIAPLVLCVEFDSPAPVWRVHRVLSGLRAHGYRLAIRDGDNVTFVRGPALA